MNDSNPAMAISHPISGGAVAAAVWLALLLLLLAPGPATSNVDHWVIDPEHFAVAFLVDHAGYAATLGLFLEAEGEFRFDPEDYRLESGSFVVQTGSVFTNHDERDEHLRSEDFLDVARHPEMRFEATSWERTGDEVGRLHGQLELLGERRPLVLETRINKVERYPMPLGGIFGRPYVLGASMRGAFNRSDFGMTYGLRPREFVGDRVELIIEFEAQRQ